MVYPSYWDQLSLFHQHVDKSPQEHWWHYLVPGTILLKAKLKDIDTTMKNQ